MEDKAFQSMLKEGRGQLVLGFISADYPDPQDWFSGNFGCGAANNKYGYCNPAFDAAARQGDQATDQSQRLAAYAQAQQILVNDLPVVPLFYRGRMVLVKPWVQNLVITPRDEYPGLTFLSQVSVARR